MDMDAMMQQLEDAEAMLLEPRECYDAALIGVASRAGGMCVAAYDTRRCIDALCLHHDWERDEAEEFFDFNVIGAWIGPGTPLFVALLDQAADGKHDEKH